MDIFTLFLAGMVGRASAPAIDAGLTSGTRLFPIPQPNAFARAAYAGSDPRVTAPPFVSLTHPLGVGPFVKSDLPEWLAFGDVVCHRTVVGDTTAVVRIRGTLIAHPEGTIEDPLPPALSIYSTTTDGVECAFPETMVLRRGVSEDLDDPLHAQRNFICGLDNLTTPGFDRGWSSSSFRFHNVDESLLIAELFDTNGDWAGGVIGDDIDIIIEMLRVAPRVEGLTTGDIVYGAETPVVGLKLDADSSTTAPAIEAYPA